MATKASQTDRSSYVRYVVRDSLRYYLTEEDSRLLSSFGKLKNYSTNQMKSTPYPTSALISEFHFIDRDGEDSRYIDSFDDDEDSIGEEEWQELKRRSIQPGEEPGELIEEKQEEEEEEEYSDDFEELAEWETNFWQFEEKIEEALKKAHQRTLERVEQGRLRRIEGAADGDDGGHAEAVETELQRWQKKFKRWEGAMTKVLHKERRHTAERDYSEDYDEEKADKGEYETNEEEMTEPVDKLSKMEMWVRNLQHIEAFLGQALKIKKAKKTENIDTEQEGVSEVEEKESAEVEVAAEEPTQTSRALEQWKKSFWDWGHQVEESFATAFNLGSRDEAEEEAEMKELDKVETQSEVESDTKTETNIETTTTTITTQTQTTAPTTSDPSTEIRSPVETESKYRQTDEEKRRDEDKLREDEDKDNSVERGAYPF